jgi:hypothetical protein
VPESIAITAAAHSFTIAALFGSGTKPKRRIGLDERVRRHHKAARIRQVVIMIVLGAAVIAFSLLLGRVSSSYDPIPSNVRGR